MDAAEERNIAYLRQKLGLAAPGSAAKNWKRLKNEWKQDGFAEDFADFLSNLDQVCDNVITSGSGVGDQGGDVSHINKHVNKPSLALVGGSSTCRAQFIGDAEAETVPQEQHRYVSRATRRGSGAHLRRHMKGMLNRLTEANIKAIAGQISDLFRVNSRGHIMAALTAVTLEASAGGTSSLVLSSLPVLLAALVTALHITVGREVGAFFIEGIVRALDAEWSRGRCSTTDRPSAMPLCCANIVAIIAYMYYFGTLHCSFIYDVIRRVGTRFNDRDVTLATVALRASGPRLRKDNPVSLKQAIVFLQGRIASFRRPKNGRITLAVNALLDTLSTLKNNRVPLCQHADLRRQMRKWLSRLRGGPAGSFVLRVSWGDLVSATTDGRWWLQGAAWSGRRCSDAGADGAIRARTPTLEARFPAHSKSIDGTDLVRIARLHRMNTDARCRIFCVLMGSTDFVQAFDALVRLDLRGPQEQDIVRVLIECCGLGKEYNPYFSHLANRLCAYRRQFKFTFQLAFWDIFKQLEVCAHSGGRRTQSPCQNGAITPRKAMNLSKLLAHMVRGFSLSLSILKIVNFVQIPDDALLFFRIFFETVLLGSVAGTMHTTGRQRIVDEGAVRGGDQLVQSVFSSSAFASSSGESCRDGILLFLHRHVKPRARACRIMVGLSNTPPERAQTLIERRVILAVYALTSAKNELFLRVI